MTVEELRAELEKITSDLTTSGLNNIDTTVIEKLDKIAASTGELGMKEGQRLIVNLTASMKAIQEGKSSVESGNLRLTALDFYLKKQPADEIEDI